MSDKVSSKKYWLLKFLDILATVLPLAILVIVRHEKYIYSKGSAVGFSVGAIIAVAVIVLSVMDKLHLKALGISILGLALCYFLRNLLDDIEWIFLCLFIGQSSSKIINYFVLKEKEKVTIEKTAEATSKQVEKVVQTIVKNGRV